MLIEEIIRVIRIEWFLAVISIVAGTVTIVWFIRDVRKENSKILKAILDNQKSSTEVQKSSLEIQRASLEIQKSSFEIQKASIEIQKSTVDILHKIADILSKIEEGQRKGSETLAQMLLNQTKILERINNKIP